MTRPELIAHLSTLVADLLDRIPDGLSDEDAARILAVSLDRGLTWDAAPAGLSDALEALDGPALYLLILGCIRVARELPEAVGRVQARVEDRRERRVERREERRHG